MKRPPRGGPFHASPHGLSHCGLPHYPHYTPGGTQVKEHSGRHVHLLESLLKRAYIDARYRPEYSITREDLEYLASRLREVRRIVEEACRRRIESLGGRPPPGVRRHP